MKLKASLLLTSLGLLFVSSAQANVRISIPFMLKGEDICTSIAGNWSGSGNISVKFPPISCDYNGSGVMTVPSPGRLNLDFTFTKTRGSDICPNEQHTVLEGTCKEGLIQIYTKNVADLEGTLNEDGKSAENVHGTIYVTDIHIPADAHMTLKKTS